MATSSKASVDLPPGPKGDFLLGNLSNYSRDPLGFLSNCALQYGDIVRMRFGSVISYMLNHPDYIEEVLVAKRSQVRRYINPDGGKRVFGNGLVTSEWDFWRNQRRMIQPAFHRERIATYADVMVTDTNRLLATWQPEEIRDIHQEMMNLTLSVIGKTLFDTDLTAEIEQIGKSVKVVVQHFDENRDSNALLLLLGSLLDKWLPTPRQLHFCKAVKQLDDIVYGMIHQHRTSGSDRGDLLSMLLHVQDSDDSQITNQQLRDEVINLLLAGYDTTASTLSWTWMLLSQHPVVEAKLLQELQAVLGGRVPTIVDLPQLRYTEMIVLEAMRLYPPIWLISLQAVQDCEIGGYPMPAGTLIFMSQWVMHRHSRYFDRPEDFNPERWADDLAKIPTYAYFPFGGGPRVCIGKSFALMEAVLIVATIAQKFRLMLVPEHPLVPQPSISLCPKYGIKMLLTKRC